MFIGSDGRPTWRTLKPTDEDIAEAAARRQPPRLSVWDLARCRAAQAREISGQAEGQQYTLRDSDVADASAHWEMPHVRVVEDPLMDEREGAAAHCGIEGLEQFQGEKPAGYKQRLSFLSGRLLSYSDFLVE